MSGSDDRRYVRAIEAAWSKLQGRAAVVSPREYQAIDGWRRRGIPLAVVLEVIADAGKRRSHGSKAITSLAPAVEEAWSAVAAGRAVAEPVGSIPSQGEATRAWDDALVTLPAGTPVHTLLTDLVQKARAGQAGAELDQELDERLPGAVPRDVLAAAERETLESLASFRGRMSEPEYRSMASRALVDRLRAGLRLPRLALTR